MPWAARAISARAPGSDARPSASSTCCSRAWICACGICFHAVGTAVVSTVAFVYVWRKGVLDWGPESDPDYVRPPRPGPALVKRYVYGTRD